MGLTGLHDSQARVLAFYSLAKIRLISLCFGWRASFLSSKFTSERVA